MSGFRSQAAALPPRASNLTLSAEAYGAGDAVGGERMFRAAFDEVLPLVRVVVARHLDGVEDREEASMTAMSNIWRAVRAGTDPAITLYATNAAIDRHRRESKHAKRRAFILADEPRTDAEDDEQTRSKADGRRAAKWSASRDHADDAIGTADAARLADDLGAVRPLWGEIARCLAAGLTQFDTARELKRPEGTVTRNVVEMRLYLEGRAA